MRKGDPRRGTPDKGNSAKGSSGKGSLRIIAGSWRGRKLSIADAPGLRPTPDRVRETAFNWLAGDIADARCLDLFAGSGALGLEALSRGAAHCCFVEKNPQAARMLSSALATLDATARSEVLQQDALAYLDVQSEGENCGTGFDLVFLDPPFADDLLAPALASLADAAFLSPEAQIYFEHASSSSVLPPPGWGARRNKRSGDVSYGLLERV